MFFQVCMLVGFAGNFSDALQESRTNFINGDYSAMENNLIQAKKSLRSINKIAKPEELAFMVYLSSLVVAKRGGEPLDLWRETFSIYGEYEGESDLFANKEQADLFIAIRMEMEYADQKTAYIPKKFGLAKIYIDGQEKKYEATILPGTHFLQIICPKGEIVSKWHTLEEDPLWLSMCPYEIDVNASNNDDPFSLDGIDDSFDEESVPEISDTEEDSSTTIDTSTVEVKEEKPKKSAQPESYFSGVKVKKMKAKPIFWGGVDGGVFVDAEDTVQYHGSGIFLYHLGDLELEFHAGSQLSGGLNYIVIDGLMFGIHAGYHILYDDVLLDARFRKNVPISDRIHGYTRVRFGYQYSWSRVFGGVDIGLVFPIF
ncbi:MAG: hypothetical protein CL916_09840 [Deltaproteobacteria bacterium]|nr:hypothetical protein [Deltaproteobacteria bacterium]